MTTTEIEKDLCEFQQLKGKTAVLPGQGQHTRFGMGRWGAEEFFMPPSSICSKLV